MKKNLWKMLHKFLWKCVEKSYGNLQKSSIKITESRWNFAEKFYGKSMEIVRMLHGKNEPVLLLLLLTPLVALRFSQERDAESGGWNQTPTSKQNRGKI